MKCLYLTLCFAQFSGRRETLTDRLSADLASQPEVRAMAGVVGLMTMAGWLSTAAIDGGDRAASKITQFQDLHQNGGTLLFQGFEGHGQRAPPILTYSYVRIITPKKEDCRIPPCMSRTRAKGLRPHSSLRVLRPSAPGGVAAAVLRAPRADGRPADRHRLDAQRRATAAMALSTVRRHHGHRGAIHGLRSATPRSPREKRTTMTCSLSSRIYPARRRQPVRTARILCRPTATRCGFLPRRISVPRMPLLSPTSSSPATNNTIQNT